MKLLLLIWMIFTIILNISFVGLALMMPNDYDEPSTWMNMGIKITDNIILEDGIQPFLFFIWMFFTVLLGISLIGIFMFIPKTRRYEPSTWMLIGRKLIGAN